MKYSPSFIIGVFLLLFSNDSTSQTDTFHVNEQVYVKQESNWYALDLNDTPKFLVGSKVITVKFWDWVTPSHKQALHTACNATAFRISKSGFVDVEIQNGDDVTEVLTMYKNSTLCEYVELNTVPLFHATFPNDVHYTNGNQWYLDQINMPDAWDIETGDPSIVVAIIDQGFDFTHEDIGTGSDVYENVWANSGEDAWSDPNDPTTGNGSDDDGNFLVDDWKGWDFDNDLNISIGPSSHGSAVAGIVGGKTNNGLGIAGIAGGFGSQGCLLMNLKVGGTNQFVGGLDNAIDYAADYGASIIQMSLEKASSSPSIDAALERAYNDFGVVIVCSAGNGADPVVSYPSSDPHVISVGATDMNDERAFFSDMGPLLEVSAPGVGMFSTKNGDAYALAPGSTQGEGTSFAAPQVSGVAALMLSANPGLSPDAVRAILQCSADKVGTAPYDAKGRNDEVGYGRLNAYQAVLAASTHLNDVTISSPTVWSTNQSLTNLHITSTGSLTIQAEALFIPGSEVIVDPGGKLIVDGGTISGCHGEFRDGLIHVKEGSLLHFTNGGQVIMGGEGKILIDANGSAKGNLKYDANSSIFLNDNQTVLEIKGRVFIGDNADFSFSGDGFTRFNAIEGPPPIVGGNNSRIILDGSDINDKLIEITNGEVSFSSNLSLCRVTNGAINFITSDARMKVAGNLILNTTRLATSGMLSAGLQTFGASLTAINNCIFTNTPLITYQYLTGFPITINGSQFIHNVPLVAPSGGAGLIVVGGGFNLIGCTFQGSLIGLESSGLSYPSSIRQCVFDSNLRGMWLLNASGNIVKLVESQVTDQIDDGIMANDVTLSIKCGSVTGNGLSTGGAGIQLDPNSILNMSTVFNAGFVDASGNYKTIEANNAYSMELNLGNNNLDPQGTSIATGTIQDPIVSLPVFLYAENNQWNAANDPLDPADYALFTSLGNFPITIVDNAPGSQACTIAPPDPCTGYPTPCKNMPIIFCPTCPLLSTVDFNGVALNDAIKIANSNMEINDSTMNDLVAIDMFHQILSSHLDLNDPAVASLAHDAYVNMKNALGSAFGSGRITAADNIPSLHASVQQLLDIQDSLTEDSITSVNFRIQFFLETDKAQVYRLVGDRNTAVQILTDINNCFLTDDEYRMLKFLIDFVNTERFILDGQFAPEAMETLLYPVALLDVFNSVSGLIDTTAVIDSSVSIGSGVSIGANTTIESGASIGDNTTIGGNVTIGQDVTVGTGSAIGDNTVIAAGTRVGSGTAIGQNVTVAEKIVIGDNTTIGDYATVQEKAVIGSGVTIGAYTAVGEKAAISDGAALGESNMIGGKTAIGANAVLEIGGTLDIQDNATFTFSPGNAGCGYIRFTNPAWNHDILAGNNSGFELNNEFEEGKVQEVLHNFLQTNLNLVKFTT